MGRLTSPALSRIIGPVKCLHHSTSPQPQPVKGRTAAMNSITQTAPRRNILAALPFVMAAVAGLTLAAVSGLMMRDAIEAHLYAILISAE